MNTGTAHHDPASAHVNGSLPPHPRICVIGAGSIGGLLRAPLIRAGNEVTVIARGAQLAAIRQRGLRLIHGRRRRRDAAGPRHRPLRRGRATGRRDPRHEGASGRGGRPRPAAPAARGHDRGADAERHPVVVFPAHGGEYEGRCVRAVDPNGAPRRRHRPRAPHRLRRLSGRAIVEPGVIRHIEGNRFPLGELDGSITPRIEALVGSCSSTPASRRRSCTTSAPRSGSSCGATSPSIRSAR